MPSFKWETSGEFAATVEKSKPKAEKFAADAQSKGETAVAEASTALKAALIPATARVLAALPKSSQKLLKLPKMKELRKKAETSGKNKRLCGRAC